MVNSIAGLIVGVILLVVAVILAKKAVDYNGDYYSDISRVLAFASMLATLIGVPLTMVSAVCLMFLLFPLK